MAPSGDPSTFTFTFDAFPNKDNVLFEIEIGYTFTTPFKLLSGEDHALGKVLADTYFTGKTGEISRQDSQGGNKDLILLNGEVIYTISG
jgi:hypothetical protein